MPRASEIAMQELDWEEVAGLRIENRAPDHAVVQVESGKVLYTSTDRNIARAFIEGYIRGKLHGMTEAMDKVFPHTESKKV